jgi:hypothetical protein
MSRGHIAATHDRSVYADLRSCTTCIARHNAAVAASNAVANAERARQGVVAERLRVRAQAALRERDAAMGAIERITRRCARFVGAALAWALAMGVLFIIGTTVLVPSVGVLGPFIAGCVVGVLIAISQAKDSEHRRSHGR